MSSRVRRQLTRTSRSLFPPTGAFSVHILRAGLREEGYRQRLRFIKWKLASERLGSGTEGSRNESPSCRLNRGTGLLITRVQLDAIDYSQRGPMGRTSLRDKAHIGKQTPSGSTSRSGAGAQGWAFCLKEFVERYEGRYRDIQLTALPIRPVERWRFHRKKPAAAGSRLLFRLHRTRAHCLGDKASSGHSKCFVGSLAEDHNVV